MYQPLHLLDDLTPDERQAIEDGFGCGVCLDFGQLTGIGPCPRCTPDLFAEDILTIAAAQLAATYAEEDDQANGIGWEAA